MRFRSYYCMAFQEKHVVMRISMPRREGGRAAMLTQQAITSGYDVTILTLLLQGFWFVNVVQ